MNVTCPHCTTAVRVDEAHLPTGGKARVGCPQCKKPFEVAGPSAGAAPGGPGAEAWLRQQLDGLKDEIRRELLAEVLGARGAGPGGASGRGGRKSKLALVCEDEQAFAGSLVDTLKALGWQPEVVPDVEGALRLLERHEYGLVTVDRTLAGDPQGGLKVLDWLNRRPGPERRRVFVAYVTDEIKSMDTGSAFIAGANLTVNKNDASRLPSILSKGLEERDELYRTFEEVTESVARGE